MERSPKPRPPLVAVPVPSARPEHGTRFTLPMPLTPLVGRLPEATALSALLRRSAVRLLTLTGAPGIGKTRLAVHVATEQAAAFRDGVIFLPLAAIRDARLVVPVIARAVGAREASGVPQIESISAALRDRKVLLVLDNFEQVASAAPDIAALLAACPKATALVTSRSVLRVRGEHEYIVPPLGLPDVAPLPALTALARCEAVALFLQCARAMVPDFRLTPANARAVAEICVQLDGLPLAIELAVPRLKLFAPDALRTRLERRLPWLTDGPHDLPMRHRALRSAIAWSDELLQPDERRLFRRLAVFAGGWTMEAAEAVGADDDPDARRRVVDGMASLLDKSLLRRISQGDDAPRFGMLETIREYGLEQLAASDEEAAVRQRHAAYYTARAEEAEPHLYGAEQAAWLEQIEREHDNIRGAFAWLLDCGEAETALRLSDNLRNFWLVHDHLSEGQQWAERALALGNDAPIAARARGLSCAASCAFRLGDYARAKERFEENLALCRAIGDGWLLSQVLINLGSIAAVQEEMEGAVARFAEGLALAREVGDRRTAARALNLLGEAARFAGDDARAVAYYEESLPLWRDLAETERIAMVLRNLGPVIHRLGDHARARAIFAESLALSWQLRNTHGIAVCLAALAGTMGPENAAHAARLLSAADALRISIGVQREPVDQAEFDRGVATARARLGDAAFAAAWAEGAALTPAQAVEAARRVLAVPSDTPPARRASDETIVPVGGLTRREHEVAAHVALGRTNREIAGALFIAEKTVEMHVSNSLSKLGLRSRTQLAAWALAQGATATVTLAHDEYD